MTDLYRELESQDAIEKSDSDLTNENIDDVRKYIETKDNSEGIHVAVSNAAEADTASEAKLQEPNQGKELESKEKVEGSSVDLTTEYNEDDNEAQDTATSTPTDVSAENAEEVEKVIDSLFDFEQVAASATTQDIPVAAHSNNAEADSIDNVSLDITSSTVYTDDIASECDTNVSTLSTPNAEL